MTRVARPAWIAAAVAAAFVATIPTPRAVYSALARTAAVNAAFAPDSISGVTGQQRTVALNVNVGTSQLASYTVDIAWDSTIVRLDSVRAGDFSLPTIRFVNGGEAMLTSALGTGSARGGAFSLAQLYFRFVNDTIGKRTPIQATWSEMTAADFSSLLVDFAMLNGVARILPPPVLVRFEPDSLYERVGFKPEMDLVADLTQAPGVALGSYVATVAWDTTIMVLDSVRAGTYAAPTINILNAGQVKFTAADAQGAGGSTPTLAQMFFRFVNASFPTLTALNISVSEMHAALTFADLLPGVVARSGKAVIGGVLRGDIDIGGTVTALDAQVILLGVVGDAMPAGAVGLPNGDADCNGTLQAKDAQIVLNYVVGNDVSQFCGGKIR